jgi:fumarate reductase subunit C
MSRFKPAERTYVRTMAGWWRTNPWFVRYMIRESSALFLSAYALVLLAGLFSLALGETAFDVWRAALATAPSIVFHIVALLFVGYHSFTWFKVMPKTAPDLPIDPKLITAGALALSAAVSVLILTMLWWITR